MRVHLYQGQWKQYVSPLNNYISVQMPCMSSLLPKGDTPILTLSTIDISGDPPTPCFIANLTLHCPPAFPPHSHFSSFFSQSFASHYNLSSGFTLLQRWFSRLSLSGLRSQLTSNSPAEQSITALRPWNVEPPSLEWSTAVFGTISCRLSCTLYPFLCHHCKSLNTIWFKLLYLSPIHPSRWAFE